MEFFSYSRSVDNNHALIMVWIFVWMATFVAVDKGAKYDWFASSAISMLAVALNAAIGLLVITTYLKFLKELDEMQQKIQLNALALGMGVGLVGTVTYTLSGVGWPCSCNQIWA